MLLEKFPRNYLECVVNLKAVRRKVQRSRRIAWTMQVLDAVSTKDVQSAHRVAQNFVSLMAEVGDARVQVVSKELETKISALDTAGVKDVV